METSMKQIRIQILDLVDKHKGNFDACPGCDICSKIKFLQKKIKKLEREPAEKFKSILEKGQDMTRSDIEFLLTVDVQRREIRKALKMSSNDFLDMMVNFGFSKRRADEMSVITIEEYQAYKAQGLTDTQIAVKKNTSPTYLSTLKKKWKISKEQPDTSEKKQNECNCVGKEEKAKYEQTIAELRGNLEQASVDKVKIQELQKDIDFWKKKVLELSSAKPEIEATNDDGPDYHELFNEAMAEKENLQKEILTLENQIKTYLRNSQFITSETSRIVNDIEREKQELQKKYNELLDENYSLKEVLIPLRQLVLIGLRDEAGTLT